MKKNNRLKLILNIVSFVVTTALLVTTLFAWYTANKTVSARGMSAVSSNENSISFKDTVYAERHNLNGDVISNTYTRVKTGELYLVNSVTTPKTGTATTVTHQTSEKIAFYFEAMLPGEYVDITVGYHMVDTLDGVGYSINLRNITAGSFKVEEKLHYVAGAYKFKNISLTYGDSKTACSDFTASTDDTWILDYDISKDDTIPVNVPILTHTWDKDYDVVNYTFRITEDFTQYYRLLGQATSFGDEEETGNLLSKKSMKIGQLFILQD